MNRVVGVIAIQDLGDPLSWVDQLAIRAYGDVCGGEGVKKVRWRRLELRQGLGHPPLLGLKDRSRMEGHEATDLNWPARLRQVTRPIKRMEAGDGEVIRVADVMQPAGGNDEVAITVIQPGRELLRAVTYCSDVTPPRRQVGQQLATELSRAERQALVVRHLSKRATPAPPGAPRCAATVPYDAPRRDSPPGGSYGVTSLGGRS